MSDNKIDIKRRRLLALTSVLGATGLGFCSAPFLLSMNPSARAKAQGAPVEIDITKLKPGVLRIVEWRSKPVWIVRRTPDMLARLDTLADRLVDPFSAKESQQPGYAQNLYRSIQPELSVLVGICTHLGCVPLEKFAIGAASGVDDNWPGGYFCPCHGSKFDLAGRVYKNVPAPTNLVVPPYAFITDRRIVIVEDPARA